MKKTVVLDIVALSPRVIGEHTPFLKNWIASKKQAVVEPELPADIHLTLGESIARELSWVIGEMRKE